MNLRTASQMIASIALALAVLLATSGGSAQAQDLKDKTIMVPFPPGGTADNIARLITQQANTAGFMLIVENRPGANGAPRRMNGC